MKIFPPLEKESPPPTQKRGLIIGKSRANHSIPQQKSPVDDVLVVLQRILNNQFVLFRDIQLEDGSSASLVLVGPAGIYLLCPHIVQGVFQVVGNEWNMFDERQHKYKPVKPNLVQETRQKADTLTAFLNTAGNAQLSVEPVLIFTHPGMHIEMTQPEVRIVLVDGLERFVGNLMRSALNLSNAQVNSVFSILSSLLPPTADEASSDLEDAFSFKDGKGKSLKLPEINLPRPKDEKVVNALNRVPLSSRQLLIIGFLVIVNIMILVFFVLLVLFLF